MQPTFLPWQGYFALIANADCFVFLDDFQFSRRSYHHRNRIFISQQNASWMTVPVEHNGTRNCAITEAYPILKDGFRKKFSSCLRHSYSKTTYFDLIYPKIINWIDSEWTDLASLNMSFICMVSKWLNFSTSFSRSSEFPSSKKRSGRIVDLLMNFGARSYLSAPGSFDYMIADDIFPLKKVDTYFQQFESVRYPQHQSADFISQLSVLDALFHVGPAETRNLIYAGQKSFIPWDEMSKSKRE
jgi:hypothetical protein